MKTNLFFFFSRRKTQKLTKGVLIEDKYTHPYS